MDTHYSTYDCLVAVRMIYEPDIDRSPFSACIQEIKHMPGSDGRVKVVAIRREHNTASHLVANFGRCNAQSMTWEKSAPADVLALCQKQCNLVA